MNQHHFVIPRIHSLIEFPEFKMPHLLSILSDIYAKEGHLSRIVILTSHDRTARFLSGQLNRHRIRVSPMCASRKPKRKRRATDGFNGGRFQVLIVSQSGLDAETGEISHFINYDMELPYPLNNNRSLRTRMHG